MEKIVPKSERRRIWKKRRIIVEDQDPKEERPTRTQLIVVLAIVAGVIWFSIRVLWVP